MKVSIIIVCMNNMRNICPCLNSIKAHTKTDIEILLVAYKFSEENLNHLKKKYPWVKIIISNEIRGFSENNNLALKQASGEYCFILNDDTYFDTPVIDNLYESMISHPDVDIMSPNLYYPDGRIQYLGRPQLNAYTFILTTLKLWGEENMRKQFLHKCGIYDIDNISGAAFMIKTDVFKRLGWFDETYFFSPEDIALSTLAKKMGYKICQNSNVHITHIASGTSSAICTATLPASIKGHLIFYSNGKCWKYWLLCLIEYPIIFMKFISYRLLYAIKKESRFKINAISELNTLVSIGSNLTPKQLFIKYYNHITNSNIS